MNSPASTEDEMLSKAVRRAARTSAVLIGSALNEWSRAFGGEPAHVLGIDAGRLDELALCRRPRPDHWLADARTLAAEFSVDPDRLISLLRAAESAEVFRYAHPVEADRATRLLAARDRDEEE